MSVMIASLCIAVVNLAAPALAQECSSPGFCSVDDQSLLQTSTMKILAEKDASTHVFPLGQSESSGIEGKEEVGHIARSKHPFCVQSRLLPSLYLLGAQKAGTTSLAADLMNVGVQSALRSPPAPGMADTTGGCWQDEVGNCWTKEFHFWDQSSLSLPQSGQEWFEALPKLSGCEGLGGRRILADFTPNNMRMTPLPNGTKPSGFHYSSWFSVNEPSESVSLPSVLSGVYPDNVVRKITFVVLLREPVARMQSAFYHAQAQDYKVVCFSCKGATFEHALTAAVDQMSLKEQVVPDWVWTSLYGRHLEEWLTFFQASQFLVIPSQSYFRDGFKGICTTLSVQLADQSLCDDLGKEHETAHLNVHHHLPLEDDVPRDLLTKARNMFDAENLHLAQVLAKASKHGAVLHGLKKDSSESQVHDWLLQNW